MSHRYVVLPFIVGLNMSKVSSSNAQLELLTEVYNSTYYRCTYKTGGSTQVYSVTYYSLTFDQTAVQETQSQFLDTLFKTGTNSVEAAFTLVASSAANFHAGINGFNFTNTNGLNLAFSMTTPWTLSTTSAYLYVNISTWNYRNRTCGTSYPYYESSGNLCYSTCPAGFYTNATYSFCSACMYSCLTCNNGSTCASCDAAKYRTLSSNLCPCNTGYYDSGVATCTACHYSCATCSSGSSSSNCSTCAASNFRTLATGSCLCNSGYFDNGVASCTACHYSCATCSNATAQGCLTCTAANLRTLSGTTCPCNAAYYDSGVALCAACLATCATCTTGSNCTICRASNATPQPTGGCTCNIGYYSSSASTCSLCHYTCNACSSSTNVSCTSCISSAFRTLSTNSCPCNAGYYDNGVTTCATCQYSCLTCSVSASNCSSCSSANFRTLTGNACPCNTGYYDSGVAACTVCYYTCATCTGSTSTSCATCFAANHRTISGGSCPCDFGYYDAGTASCQPCLSTCAACTNGTDCTICISSHMSPSSSGGCSCDAGYYLNTTTLQCIPCDNTCSVCNSTNCTTCASSGMTISDRTCVCTSSSSYYNSTSRSCIACGTNCATCTSSTSCTSCTSPGLSITGGTCTCVSGGCVTCGTACASCTSSTSCTTCVANGMTVNGGSCTCTASDHYFDSSSNACVQCSLGCAACINSTNCTSCKSNTLQLATNKTCVCITNGQYYNTSGGTCVSCPTGCASCTNSSQCLTCIDSQMTIVSGLCKCPSQKYFNTSTNACTSCPSTCTACTGSSSCTSCVDNQMTTSSGVCACPTGKYFNTSASVCQACLSECLSCSSGSTCDSCDSTVHRQLNTTTSLCVCASGYALNTSTGACYSTGPPTTCSTGYTLQNGNCVEICGDGKLFELDCDDGNLQNGDGCDSTCHIETDFVCRNGSQTSRSICSYNKSLNLELRHAIKNLYANSIIFRIGVSPALKIIDKFDTTGLVSTNLPTEKIESWYSNGVLSLEIVYTTSIQNSSASIQLTPPNNEENAYAMRVSSTIFVVKPDNNQPAIYYEPTVYTQAKLVDQIATYTVLTALVFTFIGVFIGKTIVLQMITAIQVSLFLLSLIPDLSPYLSPVATWVRMSNGYNTFFFYLKNLMTFNHPQVPSTLYAIEYEAEFLYNVNVLLFAEGGILLVVAIFMIINLFKSGHRTSCAEKIAMFFARELALSLIVFGGCCVVFCTIVNILYGKDDSNFLMNIIIAGVAYIPIFYILIEYSVHTDKFKDCETLLKKDRLSQLHPIVLLTQRMTLTILIALQSVFSQAVYAVTGLQVIYTIYVIAKRPYQKGYLSARSVLNELLLLVAIFVPLYYTQLSDKFSLGVVQEYLPWFLNGSMIGTVGITIVFFSFWCLQRWCGKPSDNQILPMSSAEPSERKNSDSDEASKNRDPLEVMDVDESTVQINSPTKSTSNILGVSLKRGGIQKYRGFAKQYQGQI